MSKDNGKPTFVERVLNRDASDTDIDDYVDEWHDSGSQQSLAFYLGLSMEEYALWVEQPASLRAIFHTRRGGLECKRKPS